MLLCIVDGAWQRAAAQEVHQERQYYAWGHQTDVMSGDKKMPPHILPLVQVKGNKFVNAAGDTILFRGVAIADPDKLEQQGRWNKNLFVQVKELGAMIVRIPVHPVPWRMRTPEQYLPLLDQAVEWCSELGMYVDIDWHSIGNLGMELFQNPVYNTTRKETYEFWRTMAIHFKGNTTVAFYELFNEPTVENGKLGSLTWSEWKAINENIIRLIRAYDTEKIPLVAGLDWAYDLTPLRIEPIQAAGIGYVTHPYQHKRKPPYEPKWEEDFGFAASEYPVVATEFGFIERGSATEEYKNAIVQYLERNGISWICWVFDPDWYPQLIESFDTFKLTGSGEFFQQALRQNLQQPNRGVHK
ncbi:MAG TPA: cellulase family glycosylhydrolase, partial [Bacteroidota bacterium]|nr:cellulase family glycosylhydrolase [Bacteroidota bacterium]